ncbi:MAG: 30S ribosomal protein S12 methylthiotransferase RimO [Phycisphaerae bacterium]|nr:30S ribosomal protein S12 methylthiotransferase RimO [Phycisphaerae bacterium]
MNNNTENEPIKVSFVTLGCAKNLVDSEKMLGLLGGAGFMLTGPDTPCDVTIINTCGFIEEARDEAMENIEEVLERKRQGQTKIVIVTGCLAQLWQGELLEKQPEIDAVLGLDRRDKIVGIVNELLSDSGLANNLQVTKGEFRDVANDQGRLRITESCWGYLRISEGCDQKCTFCTIPFIRGNFRSKPMDAVIEEAKELANDGVVELNLIGQETSGYGQDLNDGYGLAELLVELNKIEKLKWIRVLYVHPATLSDKIIEAMAKLEKVVPYIDIPLQHISDNILKLMNRKLTKSQTIELLEKIRKQIPDVTLRTTMLVGFPGETDDDFAQLLEFVKECRFDALSAFMYSFEKETASAKLPGHIDEETQIKRYDAIMTTQQEIAFELADELTDKTIDCMITSALFDDEADELGLDPDYRWVTGRHQGQGPEVDSVCYITVDPDLELTSGDILPIKIIGRLDYDLVGEIA